MKAGELKTLMLRSVEEIEKIIWNCRVEINQNPSKVGIIAMKMAGQMNNLSNVKAVIKECEKLEPEFEIFKEGDEI